MSGRCDIWGRAFKEEQLGSIKKIVPKKLRRKSLPLWLPVGLHPSSPVSHSASISVRLHLRSPSFCPPPPSMMMFQDLATPVSMPLSAVPSSEAYGVPPGNGGDVLPLYSLPAAPIYNSPEGTSMPLFSSPAGASMPLPSEALSLPWYEDPSYMPVYTDAYTDGVAYADEAPDMFMYAAPGLAPLAPMGIFGAQPAPVAWPHQSPEWGDKGDENVDFAEQFKEYWARKREELGDPLQVNCSLQGMEVHVRTFPDITSIPTAWKVFRTLALGSCFRSRMVWKPVVFGAQMELPAGSMTLVSGPPDSGKTVFLKALASWYTGQEDTWGIQGLYYNGTDSNESRLPHTNLFSMVEGFDKHIPTLTVKQTLEFAFACRHQGDHAEHAEVIMKVIPRPLPHFAPPPPFPSQGPDRWDDEWYERWMLARKDLGSNPTNSSSEMAHHLGH